MPDLLRLAVVGCYLHLLYDRVSVRPKFEIVFDSPDGRTWFVWLDRVRPGCYADSDLITTPDMDALVAGVA